MVQFHQYIKTLLYKYGFAPKTKVEVMRRSRIEVSFVHFYAIGAHARVVDLTIKSNIETLTGFISSILYLKKWQRRSCHSLKREERM